MMNSTFRYFNGPKSISIQSGMSLVELMIALLLSSLVVIAATATFVSSKKVYLSNNDVQTSQDSARFASFIIRRIAEQASYEDYTPDRLDPATGRPVIVSRAFSQKAGSTDPYDVDVTGALNTSVSKGNDESYGSDNSGGVNKSDSLIIRFYGKSGYGSAPGDELKPDGTIINCAGFSQPSALTTDADRVFSIFFVSLDGNGEPELYCKYRGAAGNFSAVPIVLGVEKFNVAYGFDSQGTSVPNRWFLANAVRTRPFTASDACFATASCNENDNWRKVVAIRIGMVIRGKANSSTKQDAALGSYRMYPLGTDFTTIFFDPPDDGRVRRVVTYTIQLRNSQTSFY
jgi:type IV pilus assembly protein PilW